jgi:hypothetical protein
MGLWRFITTGRWSKAKDEAPEEPVRVYEPHLRRFPPRRQAESVRVPRRVTGSTYGAPRRLDASPVDDSAGPMPHLAFDPLIHSADSAPSDDHGPSYDSGGSYDGGCGSGDSGGFSGGGD